MNIYQWLCLLGIPTLIGAATKNYITCKKKAKKDTIALKSGIQALLRAQMNNDYYQYSAEGSTPIHARENFENCWKHYHELGGNGVMNDLHDRFLKLEIRKED